MLFGTIEGALAKIQEVPCVLSPLLTSANKYSDSLRFLNGGTAVRKSADSHKRYDLSFQGSNYRNNDIDTVMDYYHGEYGQGLIYFTDPTSIGLGKNVLRRNWATPALILEGYKNIANTAPEAVTTASLPAVKWVLDGNANRKFTILLPANHTLWLGARHTVTGNAEITVYKDGAVVGDITPTALDSTTIITDYFTGEGYYQIEITGDNNDEITIQSMIAQILPNNTTPIYTGEHIRGSGVSGMRFSADNVPYEYVSQFNSLRSFSVELTEVEEWL